jgi:hypothetical protein
MSKVEQYSLVEVACKKWPKKESDPNDDKYELPILKYNANQEVLVEQTEGAPVEKEGGILVEEEEEPRTPSQSASEEGEDEDNTDKECCGSNKQPCHCQIMA